MYECSTYTKVAIGLRNEYIKSDQLQWKLSSRKKCSISSGTKEGFTFIHLIFGFDVTRSDECYKKVNKSNEASILHNI